ncbi:MAG TPA: ribonuclease P protein component [Cyclobacteriaceae bacterium]
MGGADNYSFKKHERLTANKQISLLFKNGNSILVHPILCKFLPNDHTATNQILISVSKKKLKRSVDRNLMKRRIREAYRLNKHVLNQTGGNPYLYIGFIYLPQTLFSFHDIQEKLIALLKRLNETNTRD